MQNRVYKKSHILTLFLISVLIGLIIIKYILTDSLVETIIIMCNGGDFSMKSLIGFSSIIILYFISMIALYLFISIRYSFLNKNELLKLVLRGLIFGIFFSITILVLFLLFSVLSNSLVITSKLIFQIVFFGLIFGGICNLSLIKIDLKKGKRKNLKEDTS